MFEKRVSRFEKIPKLIIPKEFENWLSKQRLASDDITVFKLRDMYIRDCSLEKKMGDFILK